MHLSKHHGLGNDFLIALESNNPGLVPSAELAVRLCHRRTGLGADGLIFGMPPTSSGADVNMVLFNSDGSLAELSGNGLRCLAQAVARHSSTPIDKVVAQTSVGLRQMELMSGTDSATMMVRVDMGSARPGAAQPAGLAEELLKFGQVLRMATIDMGNPHLVLQVPDATDIDLAAIGARAESYFPTGMNVHLVEVENPSKLRLRVWERGAGITEACGSGACAAAASAANWGLVAGTVTVEMPGGSAAVEVDLLDGDAPAAGRRTVLIGPATHVAEVNVSEITTGEDRG